MADIPRGRKAVPCKIVLAYKRKPDGTLLKIKARLVVQGFRQREGFDYDKTYAPTAEGRSMRLLFSIAKARGMTLFLFDVSGAFLLSRLQELMWVVYTKNGLKYYARLLKTLYGLKQAAYEWNKDFDKENARLNMTPSIMDPCFYRGMDPGGVAAAECSCRRLHRRCGQHRHLPKFRQQLQVPALHHHRSHRARAQHRRGQDDGRPHLHEPGSLHHGHCKEVQS
jgi:hypothetical protein